MLEFRQIIFFLSIAIIFSACSSSSYSSRYGNKNDSQNRSENSAVRFTSKDSNKKSEEIIPDKEFDEEPVEDNSLNTSEFLKKYNNLKSLGVALTPREKLIFEVIDYLNTPYQYGGNTKRGIDCSGFTKQVFEKALNYTLPRTASEQFQKGRKVSDKSDLNFGDLVYFDTTKRKFPGHVGIYLGNNLFVHSSLSKGVTVSSLESEYWKTRYVGARRIEGLFD